MEGATAEPGGRASPRAAKPAVGFFDSGVGGLSVVRAFLRLRPAARVLYTADWTFCPYGARPDAEILSIAGLQQRIQHEFHVMIAGPATLASLLNSLQMGFRTLAIEKKSSEVWHVLGEVKTEYARFGMVLEAVKKKIASASNEIDNAFTRHRAMGRRLRDVEAVDTDASGVPLVGADGEDAGSD